VAIFVDPGVQRELRDRASSIILQARDMVDVEAATVAFARAAESVRELDAGWQSVPGLEPVDRNNPKFVSTFPTPAGPCLHVDAGAVPLRLLQHIPEILARELSSAGVDDAVIAPPPDDSEEWAQLLASGPAAVAWMFPPVFDRWGQGALTVPDGWLEPLCSWVVANAPEQPLRGRVVSVGFDLDRRHAWELLRSCAAVGQPLCRVACGSPQAGLRVLGAGFSKSRFMVSALSITAGGPAAGQHDLLDEVRGSCSGQDTFAGSGPKTQSARRPVAEDRWEPRLERGVERIATRRPDPGCPSRL
jgi:hypothetical protein